MPLTSAIGKPDSMSYKTTIGQNLELIVQQELSRMDNEWFFKWHFIGENIAIEIDSFRGTPIRYGGICYSGTVVDVYWDTISHYRKIKVAEFFNSMEIVLPKYKRPVRRQAIAEAADIIRMFANVIRDRAIKKDRTLRGDGVKFPKPNDRGRWEESGSAIINQRVASLLEVHCDLNIDQGDYYVIKNMMNETLSFLKADGSEQVDNIKGLVTGEKIFTFDTSLPIQPNDRFLRNLPSGLVEEYIVINPGYQSGSIGAIEPHYQIEVRRSDTPPALAQTIVNNVQGENARININSVDNSQNLSVSQEETLVFQQLKDQLIEADFEESESKRLLEAIIGMERTNGTPAFKEKYQEFMAVAANHASVFGTFMGALALLL